jgi:hypothetical protein
MKQEKTPLQNPGERNPIDVLQEFVDVFVSRGWLNQSLRIKRRDRRYRVCCSKEEFFAYRINDDCAVPPGFAGWPVCIVTRDRMVEDSDLSAFTSTEPSANDWLCCIVDEDFELL